MAATKTGPGRSRPIEERFWEKVDKSGDCWLWIGGHNGRGYGRFWDGEHLIYPHRFIYEMFNGSIPKGQEVDHRYTCPKSCVTPGHLRLASPKQNEENKGALQSNNTSGAQGVWWDKRTNRWGAEVHHYGKKHWLGRFSTIEEASVAAKAKRLELFTHNDLDRL